MTPNDIEILIHCHVSPTRHPRAEAPAVASTLKAFAASGILEQDGDDIYRTTRKGKALMSAICSTPFPVEAWVDGNGKAIEL